MIKQITLNYFTARLIDDDDDDDQDLMHHSWRDDTCDSELSKGNDYDIDHTCTCSQVAVQSLIEILILKCICRILSQFKALKTGS